MLDLRIVRSPLQITENETILSEYNRLTGAEIPMSEFLRWVQDGPGGPAWHILLCTKEGRIVGHSSMLPVTAQRRETRLMAAMSEFSVIHEDFRKGKIEGYENVSRPPFVIMLDSIFQHCLKEGWGPLFGISSEKIQIITRKIGLKAVEFPLTECLLVLRPAGAARLTPNLSKKQRSALYVAGFCQKTLWSIAEHFSGNRNGAHVVPISAQWNGVEQDRLSFYEEKVSASWRYIEDQYVQYGTDQDSGEYLIAKRGREDRYLRVCQYRLWSPATINSFVRKLIRQAKEEKAIGVRWSVYEDGDLSKSIVGQLRRLGFLCAPRVRNVLVHKTFSEYLQPAMWRMSDAHFTFDP